MAIKAGLGIYEPCMQLSEQCYKNWRANFIFHTLPKYIIVWKYSANTHTHTYTHIYINMILNTMAQWEIKLAMTIDVALSIRVMKLNVNGLQRVVHHLVNDRRMVSVTCNGSSGACLREIIIHRVSKESTCNSSPTFPLSSSLSSLSPSCYWNEPG